MRTAVILLSTFAVLQLSCGQALAAKPASRSLLIGGWALQKESCWSNDGYVFSGDGTFSHKREAGTWSLKGDRLTLRVTERSYQDDEPAEKVREKPSTWVVLSLTETELVQRSDEETSTLVSCPD